MQEFRFGPFVLSAANRSLTNDGAVVPVGSRAMDILFFLVGEPGRLRSNEEIVSHAWPNTFVDQSNLRVHMSALRRALGDTRTPPMFITNVPGRGYQFIAMVETIAIAAPPQRGVAGTVRGRRIYGREAAVASIVRMLPAGIVTVVGPGGIGKSTVARAVVDHLAARDHLLWIDLAELESGAHLTATVASSLRLPSNDPDIESAIAERLLARDQLVVLDSCEHVVDEAASLVDTLRKRAPSLTILATSREPLRVIDERIYRLPPLDVPPVEDTMAEALHSPAIQLFFDRAADRIGDTELHADDIARVVEICRRLDGLALAIELAAARLESISLDELATSLEQSFRLLTHGRRTAFPRHRTLRATLDWSYDVLPAVQQTALQRLSVLRGWFSVSTADAVLDGAAEDAIHELVSKSLVVADKRAAATRYRLLDMTRLYAAEKLAESGDLHATMARLTAYLTEVLEAEEDKLYAAAEGSLAGLSELVPHLRLALAWSLQHDPSSGVRLTVASVPLFVRLSLLDECLTRVNWAITYLDANPGLDERRRMKLYAALGWPQMRPTGSPRDGLAAGGTALAIAEELGDRDYQLRALLALWVDAINRMQPVEGMQLAETFVERAAQSSDPVDRVVGLRLVGATCHWLGRFAESQRHLQAMLDAYTALPQRNSAIRFQFNQRISARVIMTRNLWIMGKAPDALQMVDDTIQLATELRDDLSLANFLAEAACLVMLLSGRLELAAKHIAKLRHHARAFALDVWNAYADCFDAELHFYRGDFARCLDLLSAGRAMLRGRGLLLFDTHFRAVQAQARSAIGHHAEAQPVIDSALTDCSVSGERWCLPELLRVKAQQVIAERGTGWKAQATDLLHKSIAIAKADGALEWERRAKADLNGLS